MAIGRRRPTFPRSGVRAWRELVALLDADRAELEALPHSHAVELRLRDAYDLLDRLMRLRDAVQLEQPESKDW